MANSGVGNAYREGDQEGIAASPIYISVVVLVVLVEGKLL